VSPFGPAGPAGPAGPWSLDNRSFGSPTLNKLRNAFIKFLLLIIVPEFDDEADVGVDDDGGGNVGFKFVDGGVFVEDGELFSVLISGVVVFFIV